MPFGHDEGGPLPVACLLEVWHDERVSVMSFLAEIRARLDEEDEDARIALERELQTARFVQRAALAELELANRALNNLKDRLDTAEAHIRTLQESLAAVPWRVVGVWRKALPYIPRRLLALVGRCRA